MADGLTIDALSIEVGYESGKAASGVAQLSGSLSQLKAELNKATKPMEEMKKQISHTGKETTKSTGAIGKFIKSIGRIALYRAIRSAIKAVSEGFREGVNNLVLYSEAIGDVDSAMAHPTMNQYATTLMYVKNSIGAAVGPMLQSLLPAIQTVANGFVNATNAVNQFVSALQGKSTWTAAKEYPIDYADNLNKATGAAKEFKKQIMGFDELNIINAPNQGGGGGGAAAYDYSQMFEEQSIGGKFKDLAEKIRALNIDMNDALNMAKDVAIALAAWKLSNAAINGVKGIVKYFKDGNKELTSWDKISRSITGTLLVVVGAKWSYDAGYEITKGTASLTDYIKTVLGPIAAAVGGALIGGTFGGGYGAAIGAVIGLGVGVVFEIVGAVRGAKQNLVEQFYATEFGQEVSTLNTEIERISQVNVDLNAHIDSITGQVDDATMADFSLAKELINSIFLMDEVENKTAEQIAVIQDKITTLNGLNLEGLQGMFQTTTDGYILPTRDAVQQVMDKLLEQYKLEALHDAYVESFKAEYDAVENVKTATTDANAAMKTYKSAQDNLASANTKLTDAQKELADWIDETGYKVGGKGSQGGLYSKYVELQTAVVKAQNAVGDANTGLKEAKTATENAKTALQNSLSTYDKAAEKVGKIETAITDVVAASKSGGDNVISGVAKGVNDGAGKAVDSVKQAAKDMLKAFDDYNEIHSPSKLYKRKAGFIMDGIANGISENTNTVANAFNGLLNSMLSKMETFTNRCRSAINSMLSDFKSAMNSVSINSQTGRVSYSSASYASIPRFASGGVVNAGQLFIANEQTPELVGNVGRQTAVMNNSQIVDAVSVGVARAVASVMGNGGSDTPVNVNVDGDTLFSFIVRKNNNAVFSTGASPLLV